MRTNKMPLRAMPMNAAKPSALILLLVAGFSAHSIAQNACDTAGERYSSGFNSNGSSSGLGSGALQERQQHWQRQWNSEQAQRAQQFQQQQQAIQSLGNGLSTMLQGLFSSPTLTYEDDLDPLESPTRPSYGSPYAPPAVTYSPQRVPARAQPLFSESLSSFIVSGSSGRPTASSVASGQDSLSSFFGGGGNAVPRYQSSPEMDRFVKADIDWQHAYFDALAQKGGQSGQSVSSWQDSDLTPSLTESARSVLRDIRGEDVSRAVEATANTVIARYENETLDAAADSLQGTRAGFLTYARQGDDSSLHSSESLARNLKTVGGVSKDLRYEITGELAERHGNNGMGTAPLLNSWMQYAETTAGEAMSGGWDMPSIRDAGGKVREAWKSFLDEKLDFANPKPL